MVWVSSHKMPDGTERPIAFASRTLSSAEKNYSQLEKEGLACIFGVKRFHLYLYGRNFTIVTDHKPLLQLFDPQRGIPMQVSGRIQRWIMTLAVYKYKLVFKKTEEHGNADALSRLPMDGKQIEEEEEIPTELVLLFESLKDSPVDCSQVKHWTKKDPILCSIYWQGGHYIRLQVHHRPCYLSGNVEWSYQLMMVVSFGVIGWLSQKKEEIMYCKSCMGDTQEYLE